MHICIASSCFSMLKFPGLIRAKFDRFIRISMISFEDEYQTDHICVTVRKKLNQMSDTNTSKESNDYTHM